MNIVNVVGGVSVRLKPTGWTIRVANSESDSVQRRRKWESWGSLISSNISCCTWWCDGMSASISVQISFQRFVMATEVEKRWWKDIFWVEAPRGAPSPMLRKRIYYCDKICADNLNLPGNTAIQGNNQNFRVWVGGTSNGGKFCFLAIARSESFHQVVIENESTNFFGIFKMTS